MMECGCTSLGLKKCNIIHSLEELREPTCKRSGALRSEPKAVGDSPLKSPSIGGAPKPCQSWVCSGSSVWHHQQPSRTNSVLPAPACEIFSSPAALMTASGSQAFVIVAFSMNEVFWSSVLITNTAPSVLCPSPILPTARLSSLALAPRLSGCSTPPGNGVPFG